MFHPVLTLLIAGSVHLGAEMKAPSDFAQIVIELTEALPAVGGSVLDVDAGPSLADVPYYYSDFRPIAAPAAKTIVTYDWRSPVIFDLP